MYFTPRQYPFAALGEAHHDVLVAGGGPVGLAVALGLARRGIPVTVLEDDDSACSGSRAICLSRHSLEVLDRLGAGRALSATALPWTSGRSYYRGVEVLRFDMPHADGDPHPPMVNISQSAAEQVLIDTALATPGITLGWQHRVREVLPDDDGVTVGVRTPDGDRDLRADWLVAADGARSTVRDWLGLRLEGTSYTGHSLIADIHWPVDLPVERRVWFDPPANPGQTIILHKQPDDIWRLDCRLPPDVDPLAQLAPERVKSLVAAHLEWLGNSTPWTLEWASVYSARAMSLDGYHHGRVVFAGDAAHLVPIFGVRGLNSGFEDADTLGWMLALVVRGTAADSLLDAYSVERRAAWQQNVASADASTLFMAPGTDGYQITRDAVLALAPGRPELRDLIDPRQTAATHARTSPLTINAGDPVSDVPLKLGDGSVSSLHAERGADFTLLRFGDAPAGDAPAGDAPAGALAEFAAALRTRLAPAVGVRVLHDTTCTLAKALGGRPAEIFVIRPDGLLLGRFSGVAALGDPRVLADRILTGGGTPDAEPVSAPGADLASSAQPAPTEALSPNEQLWRTLSDALDATPAADRDAFLARLTLLLAVRQADPASFAAMVNEAMADEASGSA